MPPPDQVTAAHLYADHQRLLAEHARLVEQVARLVELHAGLVEAVDRLERRGRLRLVEDVDRRAAVVEMRPRRVAPAGQGHGHQRADIDA
jgi:hypothetical protein